MDDNNSYNSKATNQRLDLAGLNQRIQKREQILKEQREAQQEVNDAAQAYQQALKRARKSEQQQTPQEVPAGSVAARERGLRSHDAASYRTLDIERLKHDPIAVFFLTANTRHYLT